MDTFFRRSIRILRVMSARKVVDVRIIESAVTEGEVAFPLHNIIDNTVSKAT